MSEAMLEKRLVVPAATTAIGDQKDGGRRDLTISHSIASPLLHIMILAVSTSASS
jgi:hypothetical protein